jgi:hypothetical protein
MPGGFGAAGAVRGGAAGGGAGRSGSAEGASNAETAPAGARCVRGRCHRKYQAAAPAAATAATSHKKLDSQPDCAAAWGDWGTAVRLGPGAACGCNGAGVTDSGAALALAEPGSDGSGVAVRGDGRSAVSTRAGAFAAGAVTTSADCGVSDAGAGRGVREIGWISAGGCAG